MYELLDIITKFLCIKGQEPTLSQLATQTPT
jgi:hypothetical protein